MGQFVARCTGRLVVQSPTLSARVSCAASEASLHAWGGVIRVRGRVFRAGGDFLSAWIARHINAREMYALHAVIAEYCAACASTLGVTHVHVGVDN